MTKHLTRDKRRQQILAAAARCFAEKGYYETSMDDILQAAELSKGSLYWYFKNKQELFHSLYDYWYSEVGGRLEQAMATEPTATGQFRALFRSLEDATKGFEQETRARIEFLTMALRDDVLLKWKRERHDAAMKMMCDLIEKGIRSGEFRDVPADKTAKAIWASIDGALVHREVLRGHRPAPLDFVGLCEAYLAMLRVEERSKRETASNGRRKGGDGRAKH